LLTGASGAGASVACGAGRWLGLRFFGWRVAKSANGCLCPPQPVDLPVATMM